MTQAVHKYEEIHEQGTRSAWSGPDTATPSMLFSLLTESRPASGNAERLLRFKKCRPWDHSGGFFQKSMTSCRFHLPGDPSVWFMDSGNIMDGNFPVPLMPSDNMSNACLTKALVKLKSQDVHIGNFVAEGHKTIEMFVNTAHTIARQVQGFRRKSPKLFETAKRLEGTLKRHDWCLIPNKWLELQYGWNPLLSDLEGACNHLMKASRYANPFITVRAQVSDRTTSTTVSSSYSGTNHSLRWDHERKVNTFLVYGLNSPVLAELSSLGLVNPLEIVWETTRFSFVVDWLLPVSNWLSALTADVGWEFITGGQSLQSRVTFASSGMTSHSPFWHYEFFPDVSVSGSSKSFIRKCYDASPVPGLYVKNPLSALHVANAMALLAQAFA